MQSISTYSRAYWHSESSRWTNATILHQLQSDNMADTMPTRISVPVAHPYPYQYYGCRMLYDIPYLYTLHTYLYTLHIYVPIHTAYVRTYTHCIYTYLYTLHTYVPIHTAYVPIHTAYVPMHAAYLRMAHNHTHIIWAYLYILQVSKMEENGRLLLALAENLWKYNSSI